MSDTETERPPEHRRTITTTARRIFRQLRRDPHTIAMAVVIPSALVVLVRFVLNSAEEFDASAAPLIAIFPFSVMFLVTSIATLRERITGTLERLMTYAVPRIDLLLGYVVAFGLVAAVQAVLVITISDAWLGMAVHGSVVVLFAVCMVNAVLGIAFGLLGSAVSRTEYQVVQLLPIFVLPQVMICGLFAPRETMAPVLDALAGVLPLPLAVETIGEIAGPDGSAGTIARDVLVLVGYTVAALVVGAATLQRQAPDGESVWQRCVATVLRRSRHGRRNRAPEPSAVDSSVCRFEVYQEESGRYRFRLSNGRDAVATSGAFETQAEALEAVTMFCRVVPRADVDLRVNGAAGAAGVGAGPG